MTPASSSVSYLSPWFKAEKWSLPTASLPSPSWPPGLEPPASRSILRGSLTPFCLRVVFSELCVWSSGTARFEVCLVLSSVDQHDEVIFSRPSRAAYLLYITSSIQFSTFRAPPFHLRDSPWSSSRSQRGVYPLRPGGPERSPCDEYYEVFRSTENHGLRDQGWT